MKGEFDFETYSEAGRYWCPVRLRWVPIAESTGKPGLPAVGTCAYAGHPSTRLLSLAYDIGSGERLWTPHDSPPYDLFWHVKCGGILEAVNSFFEYQIWLKVCYGRMGWPPLPLDQLRDTSAKARAHGLPGGLDLMAKAVEAPILKDTDGGRLLKIFSEPHNPTKKDPRKRIYPHQEPKDGPLLYGYNITDIKAERSASDRIPELPPFELEVWKLDQRVNARGVAIDLEGLANCLEIVRQCTIKYTRELVTLTAGKVQAAAEVATFRVWLATNGLSLPNMQKKTVEAALERDDLSPQCRRALEIRLALNSAAVLKLKAIKRRLSPDGRLRGLFTYCGASRTGRWSAGGAQPQNLKSSGPNTIPDWNIIEVETALGVIATRSLERVEAKYGNALETVGGCVRGLFVAGPGRDLICSDYSAIEAVVLAMLAGEEWRINVFRTHGKIYEMCASKITGVPFEKFIEHRKQTGQHHKHRKPFGKVPELASGYQGWIGAWKAFGADKYFRDDREIKKNILKWRDDSPAIVEFWGDQYRRIGKTWDFIPERYGVEGAVVNAISNPGKRYDVRSLSFVVIDDKLLCTLPSGRKLTYHKPRLHPTFHRLAKLPSFKITYMGHNTDSTKGAVGWVRLESWGGKFVENITQAVARDVLATALVRLEQCGYPVVMHVHDEPVCEVVKGFGNIEEMEAIMMAAIWWCIGWPIRAAGGWRGYRFRKD